MAKLEVEVKLELKRDASLRLPDEPDKAAWQSLQLPESLRKEIASRPFTSFVAQKDEYYQHPAYDMREKDQVLRHRQNLRFGNDNQSTPESKLTFKGAAQGGRFKSREEIEFAAPEVIWQVFENLGFSKALIVNKHRWHWTLSTSDQYGVEISLDMVDGLGVYAEVEVVVEKGDAADAEGAIEDALKHLGLTNLREEARSYADLVRSTSA